MKSSTDGVKFADDHFQKSTSFMLKSLFHNAESADVTLIADDEQLKAHKFVLRFASSFFDTVLKQNPHDNPLIYLKGVSFEHLKNCLQFIYMGEVDIPEAEIINFLEVATDLKIKQLQETVINVSEEPQLDESENNQNVDDDNKDAKNVMNFNERFNDDISTENSLDMFNFNEPDRKPHKKKIIRKETTDESSFKCSECDFTSTNKPNVLRHKKSVHLQEKFPCGQCDSILKRKDHLKQHILSVHEKVKYSCDACDFVAGFPQMITTHKRKSHNACN